jgi:MFS family permease
MPLLPGAYMLFGMAFAINNATHFTFLPELSEEHERPVAIAVFTATLGLSSGLAPILWGLFLKESGQTAGIVDSNFAAFFAIGIAVSLLMVTLFARLPDHRPHADR